MRLYPKKLRSIEDLEREKKLLRKQTRQLDKDDFLSVENLLGKTGKGKKKSKDNNEQPAAASFTDLLPVSNPFIKAGLKILESRFMNRGGSNTRDQDNDTSTPRKNPLKTMALEFVGGYLKWKAIELSYKGIKYLIKARKEKKEHLERYDYKN